MACFLTGQAAQLLGVGMQALGLGIPVDNTSVKIVEGMRDCGLPVPPKTWFKSKNSKKSVASRQLKTVYDELESHISGLIQVVKPAIELKNIVCDRYESENCTRGEQANILHTNQETKTTLLESDDIIDLTQDLPNTVLRLPSHEEKEKVINKRPRKKQKNLKKPAIIINLDETINLDDSLTSTNMKQITVSKKSESKKQSLACPICLDSLSNENIKPMSTPCGHVYCLECLKTITETKSKCSICQRPIKFIKCIRLHI